MSLSDSLWEAIDYVMSDLYDEIGNRIDADIYTDAEVRADLLPVITSIWAYIVSTYDVGQAGPFDPLRCPSCSRAFPDALAIIHHMRFSSCRGQHSLADEAMIRAGGRSDVRGMTRVDRVPITEESLRDVPGNAEVVEVEGFVVSIPGGCQTCRGIRAAFTDHIKCQHPMPDPTDAS